MKEFKEKLFFHERIIAGSYLKIIVVARGVAQGARAPSIEMPPLQIFDKKALFLHFQFLLASLRTTVHAYNSN